jgi:hypothetical protein
MMDSKNNQENPMLRKKGKVSQIIAVAAALMVSSLCAQAQQIPRLKPLPPQHRGTPQAPQAQVRSNTLPSSNSGSPWTPVIQQPAFSLGANGGAGNPILMTDGTVLVQDAGAQDWWRLTPDQYGSYANGTWTEIASLPADYSPLYHSSAVLPDGRLIIMGGEYNFFVPVWTALGAIYDPRANTWTPVATPPFFDVVEIVQGVFGQTIGDASSVVLPNGTYMQADCCTPQAALLNAKTLTWTATGSNKYDTNNEEGWNLLPSGEVLTADAYVPIPPYFPSFIPTGTNSELYNPQTGAWSSAGSTIVQLWDSAAAPGCGGEAAATFEVGPAVLRADGTVFYMGSNTCVTGTGNTAIYNSRTGQWRPGPVFPAVDGVGDINIADGPASWEPNDKVLMMASPGFGNPPSFFFEWDGRNLNQVPGPPNAPIDGSFVGNMLVLPTGQILLTDFSYDIELYNPTVAQVDREFERRIAPVVFYAPLVVHGGGSYQVYGIRFNGMTQGAAYGDDVQAATNFPLVRITNLETSHVFYSRTHDHSSMAVASNDLVSTHFDVPAKQERGLSLLEVVANGVASDPTFVLVQ